MNIVNLTQHKATPDQVAAGVVDLTGEKHAELVKALTFNTLPTRQEILEAADLIAALAHPHVIAMMGGAPFLMAHLEYALIQDGIKPVYAFSKRESVEETQADGSTKKVAVFRHSGFVGMEQ